MIMVDGTPYIWLEGPSNVTGANIISMSLTPTRTVFVLHAGAVQVNVTFLSPIEVRNTADSIVFADH